ncbi:protein-arginine deiminase domain-containing protein [Kibdelosporangium banguiense]|uniref:protein-arginine deiminase domain-containing protein n=1 Tax=Kibdelosporangium banguiense TaxID=1365924 RepID=UPI0027DB9961|nr:protein-arginine deiminase domain-containing protein [Kibdelosporangium banguiense]
MVGVLAGGAVVVSAAPSLVADLRADVNRDGVVDIGGQSDVAGKQTWTPGRGAVFLPNIGDKHRRCPIKDANGNPLPDDKLAECNDASDDIAHAPENLAPLKTVPLGNAPSDAWGTIATVGSGQDKVRLFVNRAGAWTRIAGTDRVTADELRSGVNLGIDAKDVVRDSKIWDGRITVRFTVNDGEKTTTDDVMLRVSPVLTHHHLQQAQEVLASEGTDDRPEQQRFVKELADRVKAAGIDAPLRLFGPDDQWVQDFFEPAYVTMPGAGGKPRGLRIAIRSAQPGRPAGRQVFEKLRGPGIGAVQIASQGDGQRSVDSTGNLETIPPYEHQGTSFPAGRIIMGDTGPDGEGPPDQAMQTFLRSQDYQAPLILDTSWLAVGHVDEFVQFLPAANQRGWTIGVADPQAGLEVLRAAQRAGHGSARMFSQPEAGAETIDQVLGNDTLLSNNALATQRIEANLQTLKRETGVLDDEIVKVPQLFTAEAQSRVAGRKRQAAKVNLNGLGAYVPGAVNGIVLNPKRYVAPQQWGPVVDGQDIFANAVNAAYGKLGMTVHYVDDWSSHHTLGGEVHCGTNTFRDTSRTWWPVGS